MPALRAALTLLAAIFAVGGAEAAVISGVCPDGSMFIVKKHEDIPCEQAKLVEPNEMPPLRPQFLPRPYGWQVFQQQQDPNNPYNLVDSARKVRGEETEPEVEPAPRTLGGGPPGPRTAPEPPLPPVAAAPPRPAHIELSAEERRDLALLVELSQQRAPATFSAAGDAALDVGLAHSRAFETRIREFFRARGDALDGPVVVFHARASGPASFHGNFTFAQSHEAFHPDPGDPRQLGLLEGSFGALASGQAVLGYAVLPTSVDLGQPLDVYWNDRRLATTLRP